MAYVLQPRAMVIGQITTPYYVQPTGYVNSFAIRFYPYGFANFIRTPIQELADKDTPLHALFDEVSIGSLEQDIIEATSTNERIEIRLKRKLTKGRSRVNCTAKGDDNLWRWFGHQFYL